MKKEDFFEVLGELDDDIVTEARSTEKENKNSGHTWVKWAAVAACLALLVGVFSVNQQRNQISLSDNSTNVTVYYTNNPFIFANNNELLTELTENELFTTYNTAILRGTVSKTRNIVVDFDGNKAYRAIADIKVEQVYRGPCSAGDTISVLLPCPLVKGFWVEDTSTVSAMEAGTTGIFMPMIYDDENSIWEQNGATLDKRDIADYGFADGERYAFLETENGLVFCRGAYGSIADATSLDEIEDYIKIMLGGAGPDSSCGPAPSVIY